MSSMRTLKAGEMFAGYGGLALAVSSVFGAKTGREEPGINRKRTVHFCAFLETA